MSPLEIGYFYFRIISFHIARSEFFYPLYQSLLFSRCIQTTVFTRICVCLPYYFLFSVCSLYVYFLVFFFLPFCGLLGTWQNPIPVSVVFCIYLLDCSSYYIIQSKLSWSTDVDIFQFNDIQKTFLVLGTFTNFHSQYNCLKALFYID